MRSMTIVGDRAMLRRYGPGQRPLPTVGRGSLGARRVWMIGNSEANDIEPAIELGIRTIRVAIEEPLPTSSAAHAVVTTLDAALAIIDNWADKVHRQPAW
jgi:hypothetical protein